MKAEFVISAGTPEQFPADRLPEVAFLGRSNVGKSSLINALTGQKGLAFTSSTPGRTANDQFLPDRRSVLLRRSAGIWLRPGAARAGLEWKKLIEAYLENRETLKLSCLILDARRGWMDKDLDLKRWLEYHGRQYLVVATKIDKSNQSEQERGLSAIRKEGAEPLPFSAVTGRGVRELWQAISTTLQHVGNVPPQDKPEKPTEKPAEKPARENAVPRDAAGNSSSDTAGRRPTAPKGPSGR